MKLEQIQLENFGIFKDNTIVKIEETFSTIIGENGTGKSTILEAINLLLDRKTRKNGVHSKHIYDDSKDAIIKYIFDSSGLAEIGVFLPIEEESKVFVEMILSFNEEENIFLPTIFIGKVERLEYKNYQTLPFDKFISIVYIKHQKDDSTTEWIENQYKETNTLKDVNAEIEKANNLIAEIEPIKKFNEKVNSEIKNVFENNNFVLKVTSNISTKKIGSAIGFEAVNSDKIIKSHGSGFDKIFNIVSSVNKKHKEEQLVIVLVDELENNLFHSYQKHIVDYLKSLFDGKVQQIIATTHSPNVVKIAPNSSVTKMLPKGQPCTFSIGETTNFDFYQKDLATAIFFDYVLVVEGHSEKMFFEYLLKNNQILSNFKKLNNVFILNNQGIGFENVLKLLRGLSVKVFVLTDNDEWSGTLHGLKRVSKMLNNIVDNHGSSLTDFDTDNRLENKSLIEELRLECKKNNIFIQPKINESFEESLLSEGIIDQKLMKELKRSKLKNLSKNLEGMSKKIDEETIKNSTYLFEWIKVIENE